MNSKHTDLILEKSLRTDDTVDIMDADGVHCTSTHVDLLNFRAQDGIRNLIERGKTVTVRLTVIDADGETP
jgi:hypothetical protein